MLPANRSNDLDDSKAEKNASCLASDCKLYDVTLSHENDSNLDEIKCYILWKGPKKKGSLVSVKIYCIFDIIYSIYKHQQLLHESDKKETDIFQKEDSPPET